MVRFKDRVTFALIREKSARKNSQLSKFPVSSVGETLLQRTLELLHPFRVYPRENLLASLIKRGFNPPSNFGCNSACVTSISFVSSLKKKKFRSEFQLLDDFLFIISRDKFEV